jgi:FtsH-binding integral membrane protein
MSALSTTLASPIVVSRRPLRSAGAVFAGFATIFAVTTAVDVVMHATGIFPPVDAPPMSNALFALALGYRIVIGIAGCWLTARLAPSSPRNHALVLGAIGTVVALAGAIAMWELGPGWYSLSVAAISLPCAWIGARLAGR